MELGGIRKISVQGKSSLFWLVALHEAYGSPAELEPVRSDPRRRCYAKREGEDEATEDDFRV